MFFLLRCKLKWMKFKKFEINFFAIFSQNSATYCMYILPYSFFSLQMYSCTDLMEICEAYFLQHFSRLLKRCEEFKRILYSSKVHNRDLMNRLSTALISRLNSKLAACTRTSRQTAC